jgi:predicted transposase YdaD
LIEETKESMEERKEGMEIEGEFEGRKEGLVDTSSQHSHLSRFSFLIFYC